jgi:hypothetical protein
MRRLAVAAALLGLASPSALAVGGGGNAGRVLVTADCKHTQYKPKGIVIACGDGNDRLTHLSWSKWTTTSATGKGNDEINSCTPSCAGGRFVSYPVSVTLSKPRHCAKARSKLFSQAKIQYTHQRPPHAQKSQTLPIACPL